VVRETADTVTLVFEVCGQMPPYRAGQFLTIDPHQFKALASHLAFVEELKGHKELVRAYTAASAPHEPLAITIKEEPYFSQVSKHAAVLSPLLVHLTPTGTRIHVQGFTGAYILPPDIEQRTDHLLHVVAGSGSVPNWSILKHALREHPRLRHTFVYSNKTWDDIIYRDALGVLAAANPDRVRVVHLLTREADLGRCSGEVRAGRVSPELLSELAPDPKTAFAYVCGPGITPWDRHKAIANGTTAAARFLETTLGILKELGFTADRLKREAYG
jgi:3-ketosteroid 9alpha-monooxygenase subunit B